VIETRGADIIILDAIFEEREEKEAGTPDLALFFWGGSVV